jgi:hypothetical protein
LCHAKSISSVFASQYITSSITLNQTSIIILHFFNIFSSRSHGFHAAKITISDFLVKSFIFFVLLLQLITVAQAFINSAVIGFHTILLLPITLTVFQIKSTYSDFNISSIQAGVHGTNHELSQISIFHWFIG